MYHLDPKGELVNNIQKNLILNEIVHLVLDIIQFVCLLPNQLESFLKAAVVKNTST